MGKVLPRPHSEHVREPGRKQIWDSQARVLPLYQVGCQEEWALELSGVFIPPYVMSRDRCRATPAEGRCRVECISLGVAEWAHQSCSCLHIPPPPVLTWRLWLVPSLHCPPTLYPMALTCPQ